MTPWSNIINVKTTTNNFVSIWKPFDQLLDMSILLPIDDSFYEPDKNSDFIVEWGDGTSTTYVGQGQRYVAKSYNEFQEFRTIIIKGNIPDFGNFGNTEGSGELVDITNWGGFVIRDNSFYEPNQSYPFGSRYSQTTSISASDVPTVRGMNFNFSGWKSLTNINNIENWDLTNTTGATAAFEFTPNYNLTQVSSWDMSNVRDLTRFFNHSFFPFTKTFNFNISSWNLSSLQRFEDAFGGTQCLTNIESFDTSNLDYINLYECLNQSQYSATTTIDLSGWSFDKLRTLKLNNLGTTLNTTITSFNISEKNTYNLVEVTFQGLTSFNEDISNWNTPSLQQLGAAFSQCTSFNQPIGKWNTSNLVGLSYTFYNATSFNQPLSGWNTSKVVTMVGAFRNATSFNQDISSWNVEKVQSFDDFMLGKSSENYNYQYYDNLLNSWSEQNVLTNKTLNMGSIKYSSNGTSGKNKLINDYGWTIVDGGLI